MGGSLDLASIGFGWLNVGGFFFDLIFFKIFGPNTGMATINKPKRIKIIGNGIDDFLGEDVTKLSIGVGLAVGSGVSVGSSVGVGVKVGVGVMVGVKVGVGLRVGVGVGVEVGVLFTVMEYVVGLVDNKFLFTS